MNINHITIDSDHNDVKHNKYAQKSYFTVKYSKPLITNFGFIKHDNKCLFKHKYNKVDSRREAIVREDAVYFLFFQ